MSNVHLSIGTATDRINLIDPSAQAVYEWEPSETPLVDTFSESSLGDGRILSSYREENAIENFRIHIKGASTNLLIRRTQDIRRMLIKARNYWVTTWQGEPVYLKARGACETNFRYAMVYTGELPSDVLPWGEAFARSNIMQERTLVVERGPWLSSIPGTGNCIDIESGQSVCFPEYLEFPAGDRVGYGTSYINLASDAVIDDLPQGAAFEIDGWVRPSWSDMVLGMIIAKWDFTSPTTYEGWQVWCSGVHGIGGEIQYTSAPYDRAISYSGVDEFAGSDWLHFYFCCDDNGALTPVAKTIYLAVMGNWVVTYPVQVAGTQAYTSDAAIDACLAAHIEGGNIFYIGDMGWIRIRNTITQTVGVDFTPNERCTVPSPDGNTVGLWVEEGRGTQVRNLGTGTTPGEFVGNPEWKCDCPIYYFGYPTPPVGPTPPACVAGARVYNTGNISIPNSTWTVVPYDTERWDNGDFWDGVPAYRMEIPEDGKYLVTGHVEWDYYTNGNRWLGLKVNGGNFIAYTNEVWATPGPTIGQCQSISRIFNFSMGDYVELWAYQTSTDPSGSLDIINSGNRSPEMTVHRLDSV